MTSAKIEKRMRLATAKKQFFPNPLCRLFGRETVVGADWSVSEKLFLRFGAFSVRGTDEMDESAVWRTQNEMKITIASECRAKREGVWGMCPRIRSRRLRRLLVQNKLGLGQAYFVPTDVLFSNQMLEDLDKIWALRDIIPDPNVIETDQQNTP